MYSGSESFVLQRFPSTPELIFSLSFRVSLRGKVFNFEWGPIFQVPLVWIVSSL